MDRKKRLLNRILLVSGTSAVLLLAGYVWYLKRPAHLFYLPEGFRGWVTVRFEKPGAPALPEEDGGLRFDIPSDGVLETSTRLKEGWARDAYYIKDASGKASLLERTRSEGGEDRTLIHDHEIKATRYDSILMALPTPCDTLLWDGARISRQDQAVEVREGRKVLLHFYFSGTHQPYFFAHDSLPSSHQYW